MGFDYWESCRWRSEVCMYVISRVCLSLYIFLSLALGSWLLLIIPIIIITTRDLLLLPQHRGHKQYVTSLSWEPMHLNNGACERLASSSKDGTIRIWNARTGACLITLSQHTNSIECCRWSGSKCWLLQHDQGRYVDGWMVTPPPFLPTYLPFLHFVYVVH